MAINFLAKSVDSTDRNKVRNISCVQQGNLEQGNRGGQGFRGRGRHAERHNYHTSGRSHGGNGRGGGWRGCGCTTGATNGGRSVSTNTYIPPSEWNAITSEQKQRFLQTHATSRIQAIMTSLNNDVSTITNATQGVAQAQLQGQQLAALQTAIVSSNAGAIITPSVTILFGGKAAHTNRNG
jgi:hypothetical protein